MTLSLSCHDLKLSLNILCFNCCRSNRLLISYLTGDLVAKHILSYADHEQHNGTTQDALRQFAYQFATIQDYRHAEVQRLEDRVVGPLTNYGDTCKIAKVKGNALKLFKFQFCFTVHTQMLKEH